MDTERGMGNNLDSFDYNIQGKSRAGLKDLSRLYFYLEAWDGLLELNDKALSPGYIWTWCGMVIIRWSIY